MRSTSRVDGKVVARVRVDWRRTRSSERSEMKDMDEVGVGAGGWGMVEVDEWRGSEVAWLLLE